MASFRGCVECSFCLLVIPFLLRCSPSFFFAAIDATEFFIHVPKWRWIIGSIRYLLQGIGDHCIIWHPFGLWAILLSVMTCHRFVIQPFKMPAESFRPVYTRRLLIIRHRRWRSRPHVEIRWFVGQRNGASDSRSTPASQVYLSSSLCSCSPIGFVEIPSTTFEVLSF